MANKVFATTLGISILFLASGCLELAFSLIVQAQMDDEPSSGEQVVRNHLHRVFPLTAGVANGIVTLAAFAFAMLGLITPMRFWLKFAGYLLTLCGLFTLSLGVFLWIMTLRLKDAFFPAYLSLDPAGQSLIQQSFQCCGYYNSTTPAFVTDPTCPSPAAAALLRGCGAAVSNFANSYINSIFTTLFGIVGLDAILFLCIACLLKERKERERYRHIDEKTGFQQI
ncbi:Tetraspanin [Metarhizium album ARSEF 1941]|uniref:Tetraspanin n=1 Tax=Metarhizium album (strain ARSEF 1941) TaxID=1081103 RepID=A0A0B2WRX8_METAS|nr:Tetraspanin [Metarhizium album ARSEF 1941]KHN98821.1 Tetraspanin [Metarhizium album ARSEF 1941]